MSCYWILHVIFLLMSTMVLSLVKDVQGLYSSLFCLNLEVIVVREYKRRSSAFVEAENMISSVTYFAWTCSDTLLCGYNIRLFANCALFFHHFPFPNWFPIDCFCNFY